MTEHTLCPAALVRMRTLARAHVSRRSAFVANGTMEAKADRMVAAALETAFPASEPWERAAMIGVPLDDVGRLDASIRMRDWWSDDLVAEMAALAAPRRARLAFLFLPAGAQVGLRERRMKQLGLWGEELRA